MKVTILPNSFLGDPEATAMLQAFYSRSHLPIEERLNNLGEDLTSVKTALNKYYVGYSHASIGDCGNSTLFIEGVSLLAAKYIQDFPLYNGQETSTRYINFTKQGYVSDSKHPELDDVIPEFLAFIEEVKPKLVDMLKVKHPNEGENCKEWERAIEARSFDILRGFIPIGCKTQLSVTASLRQLQEHFLELRDSRINEVETIANIALSKLREHYPSSFYKEDDDRVELYKNNDGARCIRTEKYFKGLSTLKFVEGSFNVTKRRKRWQKPSKQLDFIGDFYFDVFIDYGCWRDLQRHRRILSPIPYVGVLGYGIRQAFNDWYIQNLPEEYKSKAVNLVRQMYDKVAKAYGNTYALESQYYMPLGTTIVSKHKASVSAMLYMLELRSSSTVHPILRNIVKDLVTRMSTALEASQVSLDIFLDHSSDSFSVSRGSSTITDSEGNSID